MACGRFVGNDAAGVDVWEWPDGRPDAAQLLLETKDGTRGDPSIAWDGDRCVVGYFDGAGVGLVIDAVTGERIVTLGPIEGNAPILVGDGRVVFQSKADRLIYERSPMAAEPQLLRDAAGQPMPWRPTGLAYLTPGSVVLWDDNRQSVPGVLCPARAGAFTASQGLSGGMVLSLDGVNGVYPGSWNDPSACQQSDGAFAFAGWHPTLRVVAGVTRSHVEALGDGAVPTPQVPRFSRPCWLLPFHATRHDQSVDSPGHAEIITDGQDARRRVNGRPVVADLASESTVDDLLALFVVLGRDDVAHARAIADRREVPVLAYWDHVTDIPNVPELVPGRDWLGVMLYCEPSESLDAFRRRAHGQVSRACGRGFGVVLTVQMFDRNGTEKDTPKMFAMQAIWRELAEAYPEVVGIAPFAVLRASHGVTAYPFLGEWLAAYGRAMTAPARPTRETPDEPQVLPENAKAAIRDFVSVCPVPQAPDSVIADPAALERWVHTELRMGWKLRLAEYLCFRLGEDWGTKGTSPEWPSKEAIARRRAGKMDVWDMLTGAGSGRPRLELENPKHHFVGIEDGAHWMAVTPVDHLANITVPGDRPTIETPLWALSSFDLGTRLAEGDRRWIDQMLKPVNLVARVIVASFFRRPANEDAMTTEEKLAISRVRFRETLKTLKADGLQCEPTLLCDTAKFDLSRAEALEEVRKLKPILQEFRETIRGASGGNELSHGVEAPYMQEEAFHEEVAAILGPDFPYTPGAGHGGEGVRIFRSASYCVHHADRGLSAEENAAIMKRGQDLANRPVVDREQIGIGEPGTPGQRVYNADYLLTSVREAIRLGLGGVTYHPHAGLWANVDLLGDVQRDAWQQFTTLIGGKPPVQETDVTTEQIAQVFAGGFFEQASALLKVTGSVNERRPVVFDWLHERISAIDAIYVKVFGRHCDLEGFGSCLRLYLDHGWTDERLLAAKQAAYDAGDR